MHGVFTGTAIQIQRKAWNVLCVVLVLLLRTGTCDEHHNVTHTNTTAGDSDTNVITGKMSPLLTAMVACLCIVIGLCVLCFLYSIQVSRAQYLPTGMKDGEHTHIEFEGKADV